MARKIRVSGLRSKFVCGIRGFKSCNLARAQPSRFRHGFDLLRSRHRRKSGVRMRLLCGPAGSGKTFRCLAEIRETLCFAPEGLPLLLVSPKQTTALLERQLLVESELAGYARLHIVSFERLAHLVFDWLGLPSPEMLDE